MMKTFLLLTILLFDSMTYFAQARVPLNPFGFEMKQPVGWFSIDKELIAGSLKRLDLKHNTLERYLDQNEGRQLLFAYIKFKQDSFTGMNPKIEGRVLRIRSPRPVDFSQFKPIAEAALRKIASEFDEQHYVVEPRAIRVASIDSVYHISEFTVRTLNGTSHRVRSRTYLIPRGTYFFQISFVDEPKKNDLSEEFDELVSSIKIQN